MSKEIKNSEEKAKMVIQKLEERVRELETELGREQRRHVDAQKNLRESECRIKELTIQSEEARKNHKRMLDQLQQKIKTCETQIEEEKKMAKLNLDKFLKAEKELKELAEHYERAIKALSELRAKGRGGSTSQLSPPP